jgi:Icc-related predicted phosphoesterase
MKVAFVGDTHANVARMRKVLGRVHNAGVNTMIQVGDFGYWPKDRLGLQFLMATSKHAVEKEIEIHWVDGNHEDHEDLGYFPEDDPVEIYPNVIWHPRGTVSEMGGKRILWMGGAVSVDKPYRTPGVSWFENEVPSQKQWDRAFSHEQVDIVVAHDAPAEAPMRGMPDHFIRDDLLRASNNMQKQLSLLAGWVRPSLYVHGHWHERASYEVLGMRVESLGHDHDYLENQVIFEDLDLIVPRG